MPDFTALVTPPKLVGPDMKPANGDIYVRSTNNVPKSGVIVIPFQAHGKIIDGEFKALDGGPLMLVVTPEGVALEIFADIVQEGQNGRRDKFSINRTVSTPNQSTVTWDALVDVVPVGGGTDYEVPAWVTTLLTDAVAAGATATDAANLAIDALAEIDQKVADVPTPAQLDATIGAAIEGEQERSDATYMTPGGSADYIEQMAIFGATDAAGLTQTTDWGFLALYGSSTTNGILSRVQTLATEKGAVAIDGSGSGQSIEQICARLGSRPARVGGFLTIPASGSVIAPISNVSPALNSAVAWHGYFEGHPERPGVLSKATGAQPGYTFTPDANGTEIPIALGTLFISTFSATHRNVPLIFNAGKNNLTGVTGGTGDVAKVIQMTIDAINFMKAKGHPVIALGHFVDTDTPEVSVVRDKIKQYNAAIGSRFNGRFIDLYAMVTDPALWARQGLTPTPADLAQQAIGNKPLSISNDALHLNGYGNLELDRLIRAKVTALGWFPSGVSLSASLVARFRPDTLGADGAAITSFVSSEGSATGLAFAVAGASPHVKANGFGTHKTVVNSATAGEGLSTPVDSLALTEATYVLVAKITSSTGAAQNLLSGNSTSYQRIFTNSGGTLFFGSGTATTEITTAGVTALGSWAIIVARFKGSDSLMAVNGSPTPGTMTNSLQSRLRLFVNAGGTSSRANAELAALDVYSKGLTDDEIEAAIQKVVTDLA